MYGPVALVDCNNFYASCERVFNPAVKNKPVVVLSNNDGMIVARSQEAKDLGIGMAVPLFKIKDKIRKYDIKVFSSNYTLYGDMSQRVMTALEQFTPDVEIYSIDEAFLYLEGFQRKDMSDYAKLIQKTVYKWTGIPVSVGIASTKTLAKIANRRAKKVKKYKGVLNLVDSPDIEKHLKATDVEDVWGVGRQYSKFLKRHSVNNALDLSKANPKWVKKHMTVMGLRTVMELNSTPCIDMDYSPPPKKAIVSSRSFGRPPQSKQEIKEAIAYFTGKAAEKMRMQDSAVKHLTVFLRTNPFKNLPQYHNGCLVELPVPTDSTAELLHYAEKGVEQIYREGYEFKKAGVMLTEFVPRSSLQMSLFDTDNRQKMAVLTEIIDSVNAKLGPESIFYAASGIKREWFMKRDMKSPHYTTDWEDLPEVG